MFTKSYNLIDIVRHCLSVKGMTMIFLSFDLEWQQPELSLPSSYIISATSVQPPSMLSTLSCRSTLLINISHLTSKHSVAKHTFCNNFPITSLPPHSLSILGSFVIYIPKWYNLPAPSHQGHRIGQHSLFNTPKFG